jgi:NADPH:quinone reductase-like Zn-dependent oxidoreductase
MKSRLKRIAKWGALALLVVGFAGFQVAYWTSTNDCGQPIPAGVEVMKAIKVCEYGTPDVLQVADVAKAVPNDNQILVRVRAAALNAVDGHGVRSGLLGRLSGGLRKPKQTSFGVDYAGVVEAVGKNVTEFKAGVEVFGGRNGAMAEYVSALADRAVVKKPANISFEQAGSVAVAAVTALQGLRDHGQIKAGQKVLINGASGGVGTFAVQIAKALGAEVIGVCSTRNVEMVRSLGADHVIDYTKENFTEGAQRYDLIFDLVNNHSFSARQRILAPNGICVLGGIGGSGPNEGQLLPRLARVFWSVVASKFGDQKFVFYVAKLNKADLNLLRELMEAGKVTPVIERQYKGLAETAEALRYLETGRARGKVVVTLE